MQLDEKNLEKNIPVEFSLLGICSLKLSTFFAQITNMKTLSVLGIFNVEIETKID